MKTGPAHRLVQKHSERCFSRAFPRNREEYADAEDWFQNIEPRVSSMSKLQRRKLEDSGIAGTALHYRFSFDVARWLARNSPGAVTIDWEGFEDTEPLDDLLRLLLQPSEDEYFDSGYVTTREWVARASTGSGGTDFDWLMAQLGSRKFAPVWRQLYDAADVPLAWDLSGSSFSKSRNIARVSAVTMRETGMRPRPQYVKREIQRPLKSVARLSATKGGEMIDVAMASLAARHRETYHFNFANPDEVYLADVGEGVDVAVFGLLPGYRFPLECTMGYLILANGVPIGYGGSSIVFKQVNTGVNIFDEYRGSEAAYLWVQVMRVYHALVGCTRYIANPYQLGGGNREALRSGAFWFYYNLGYRPSAPEIRALALTEIGKKRGNPHHRSAVPILRELASCDMHLVLAGARQGEFFDEEWLTTTSQLATQELARVGGKTTHDGANRVMQSLAKDLGIRSVDSWSIAERRAGRMLAPIVTVAEPAGWNREAKQRLRKLLRAKGGKHELDYAQRLCADDQLLQSLRSACRDSRCRN